MPRGVITLPSRGRSSGTVPKIIQLVNTAEGGTTGATVSVANSGGASGAGFDAATTTGGGTLVFDNTRVAHGTLSYKITTVASGTSYGQWSTSMGTLPQVWFREYLYFTANPASQHRVMNTVQGASACASVVITTTGQVAFLNSGGSQIFITTNSIPLNQWFRIEGYVIGHATAGQVELKLFYPMDSVTPVETKTSAATQATVGWQQLVRFGCTNAVANVGPFWIDDPGVSNNGYLGPSGLPSGAIFYSRSRPVQAKIPVPRRYLRGGLVVSSQHTPPYVPPAPPSPAAPALDASPLPSLITTFPGNL